MGRIHYNADQDMYTLTSDEDCWDSRMRVAQSGVLRASEARRIYLSGVVLLEYTPPGRPTWGREFDSVELERAIQCLVQALVFHN